MRSSVNSLCNVRYYSYITEIQYFKANYEILYKDNSMVDLHFFGHPEVFDPCL